VLVVPHLIANTGGVICAAIEYRGGNERAAFTTSTSASGPALCSTRASAAASCRSAAHAHAPLLKRDAGVESARLRGGIPEGRRELIRRKSHPEHEQLAG
jgi:hypothetical protein